MVTHGLDPAALANIDGGKVRKVSENLGLIYGVKFSHLVTSRALLIHGLERQPFGANDFNDRLTVAQVRDVYARHTAALDWSTATLPNGSQWGAAGVAGALAWAWKTNPVAVNAFAVQVRDGENLTKSDPAYTLRAFILTTRVNSTNRYTIMLATIRALYAAVRGQPLRVLKTSLMLAPSAESRESTIDEAIRFFSAAHGASLRGES